MLNKALSVFKKSDHFMIQALDHVKGQLTALSESSKEWTILRFIWNFFWSFWGQQEENLVYIKNVCLYFFKDI